MIDEAVAGCFKVLFANSVSLNQLKNIFAVEEDFVAPVAINHELDRHDLDGQVLEHDQVFNCLVFLKVVLQPEEVTVVFFTVLSLNDDCIVLPRNHVIHLQIPYFQRETLMLHRALISDPKVANCRISELSWL